MSADYRKGGKKNQKRGRRKQRGQPSHVPTAGDSVTVNEYSEQWLKRGFPWVYNKEVLGRGGRFLPGQMVNIRTRKGDLLGVGIWDEGKIEVRRFRKDAGLIDSALLSQRIHEAKSLRTLPAETTAWRLVHGENDGLPGIRVDIWGEVAVISLDSPSLQCLVDPILDVLWDQLSLSAAWLHWRMSDDVENPVQSRLIRGSAPNEIEVLELGLRYLVRPFTGHDIGLFCDMRPLRTWMSDHWRDRTVLNTFCYSGAFSVNAAAHGARKVVSVDLGAPAIEWVKTNFQRNGLDLTPHEFLAEDTFKVLDRYRRKGEMFDVVIADPPSYSTGPSGTWSVSKDLKRLIAACLRVLSPGGWLIAATNQGSMSPRDFLNHIQDGAVRAGRELQLIHQGSPPVDFPAALSFPESRYLKCWVLRG